MRHLEILAMVHDHSVQEVYSVLCDFESYPEYSDVVRDVLVTVTGRDRAVSRWEVNFRQGILRWEEEDSFDPDARTITFRQTEGDVDHFSGKWAVCDRDGGACIEFAADLGLSIPGVTEILEPIAESALKDTIQSIVTGLFGASVKFETANSTPHSRTE